MAKEGFEENFSGEIDTEEAEFDESVLEDLESMKE